MTRERSMTSGADQGAGAAERARALLTIGRAADALVIANTLATANPDDHLAHILAGECLLGLGCRAEAERASTRATELAPDDPLCAVLAVRCAASGPVDIMWWRVQRLQHLDSVTFRSRYWAAIGAALCGHETVAMDVLARMEADFAGLSGVQYAAAYVDLALSARERGRPAHVASAAAERLLGLDPLDPLAHTLRQRASEIHRPGRSRRDYAREQIRNTSEAAAAGLIPPVGQMRRLTIEAVGPVGVGIVFFAIAAAIAPAVDGGLPWTLGVLTVAVASIGALLVVQHRLRPVVALLPELGRARLLRPVARSFRTAAAVLMVVAVIGIVALFPYDTERATSLGMSSHVARTETRITYTVVTMSDDGSIPDIKVPSITTVQIPESPDPVGGFRLLRYYTGASIVSLVMAAALLLRTRSLTRPPRWAQQEA